jgi:hypothetical protein
MQPGRALSRCGGNTPQVGFRLGEGEGVKEAAAGGRGYCKWGGEGGLGFGCSSGHITLVAVYATLAGAVNMAPDDPKL